MSAPLTQIQVTIAAGASLSTAAYVGYGELIGFLMPAAWDAADITVQAAIDGTTFKEVSDDNAGVLTYKAAAGLYVYLRTPLTLVSHIKFRSGTSGAAVNQTLVTVITLLVRKFTTPTVR